MNSDANHAPLSALYEEMESALVVVQALATKLIEHPDTLAQRAITLESLKLMATLCKSSVSAWADGERS